MMKRFRISIDIDAVLSVDELWPDGDAPANPTRDDVFALIDKCGGLSVIEDWNLVEDSGIAVSEVDDGCHRALVDRLRQLSAANVEPAEPAEATP